MEQLQKCSIDDLVNAYIGFSNDSNLIFSKTFVILEIIEHKLISILNTDDL